MSQWLLFFFLRLNGIKNFTCNSGEVIFVKSWSISSRCVSPVYTRHHVSSTVSHSIILFQPVCQFTREEKAHNSIFFLEEVLVLLLLLWGENLFNLCSPNLSAKQMDDFAPQQKMQKSIHQMLHTYASGHLIFWYYDCPIKIWTNGCYFSSQGLMDNFYFHTRIMIST